VKLASLRLRFPSLFASHSQSSPVAENFILALWIFSVFTCELTHELWRDETREYLMAVNINSLSEFFAFAKYDGHPLMWRTILLLMHQLIPNPVVLVMSSLLIGFGTVYLFVRYSPFPLLIKALFVFGVVPFFANAVEARDYGLSMLLFFSLAVAVTREKPRPVLIGCLLFLEANTNQYGMYMAAMFLAGWLLDTELHQLKKKGYFAAASIAIAGVLFSFYSTRIDSESVFASPEYMARVQYGLDVLKAFKHPGEYIYYLLNVPLIYRDIFIYGLVAGLIVVRPALGIVLYFTVIFFNVVAIAFIYPQTHHQGVLLGFIMTLYWMGLSGLESRKRPGIFRFSQPIFYAALFALILPFVAHDASINWHIIQEEAHVKKSSAMAAGQYIASNQQLENAIVIGAPDYMLEPVIYYSGNRLFLAKENRFRDFIKFSREFDNTSNLMALLDTAEQLNSKYKVPVIIALGFFGIQEGGSYPTIYRGVFNTKKIADFQQKTLKLAEFNTALGDEKFQLFLYLPEKELAAYRAKYMELR
jgi:hypothetical protein